MSYSVAHWILLDRKCKVPSKWIKKHVSLLCAVDSFSTPTVPVMLDLLVEAFISDLVLEPQKLKNWRTLDQLQIRLIAMFQPNPASFPSWGVLAHALSTLLPSLQIAVMMSFTPRSLSYYGCNAQHWSKVSSLVTVIGSFYKIWSTCSIKIVTHARLIGICPSSRLLSGWIIRLVPVISWPRNLPVRISSCDRK